MEKIDTNSGKNIHRGKRVQKVEKKWKKKDILKNRHSGKGNRDSETKVEKIDSGKENKQ